MAAGADDSDGPVCRFHPNTAATTRCYACHLPLCAACVVGVAGLAFCSRACANRHATGAVELADANARVAAAMRRAWWRRVVRAVFVLAVVAAGLWLVWAKVLDAPQRRTLSDWARTLPLLKRWLPAGDTLHN